MVRQQLAQPGVTVTESKLLMDAVLGVEREVDIVIEGELDGEPIVISMEVIERNRPASLPWVQEQIQKHRNLPTNRLILVSQSGFYRPALAAISKEGGWVEAIQPNVITVDGNPVIRSMSVTWMSYNTTGCTLRLRTPAGGQITVSGTPPTDIYDQSGPILGPLAYLVQDVLSLEPVRLRLSLLALHRSEPEKVRAFSSTARVAQLGYCLQHTESGELHLIEELEIFGNCAIERNEIAFTLAELGGRRYGFGESQVMGRPTVWVGTDNQVARTTTISWRATDTPLSVPEPAPSRALHFPALLTLADD